MSEAIGPFNVSPKLTLLGELAESSDILNLVSRECLKIAKECEKRTFDILSSHRHALDTLANYLVANESITGEEMATLLEKIND